MSYVAHHNLDRSNAECCCSRTTDHGYAEIVDDLAKENARLRRRLAAAEGAADALMAENVELSHAAALAENEAFDEAADDGIQDADRDEQPHTPDPVVQDLLAAAITALSADPTLIPYGSIRLAGLEYALVDHEDEPCPAKDGECLGVKTAREVLAAAAGGVS